MEKTKRNIKMYKAWIKGVSPKKLSVKYNITVRTVRFILLRYKAKEEQGLF